MLLGPVTEHGRLASGFRKSRVRRRMARSGRRATERSAAHRRLHLHFRLLGHLKGVVYLDAEVARSAFKPIACRQ